MLKRNIDISFHHPDIAGLCMIGAFPPPMHGVAFVNAAVRERLRDTGVSLATIDLAAPSLSRSVYARLMRLPRILRGLWHFLSAQRGRPGGVLYMSVSGGWGQAYEILFLALARLRRMRIFLHHHSYAYLGRPNWLTRTLAATAGPNATHITLSKGMASRFRQVYPQARRVLAISNAALVAQRGGPHVRVKQRLGTIGFFGNLSTEKGVFDFLDVAKALEKKGLKVRAKLAGPFQDEKTALGVRQRLKELPSVEYVGPKFGADKETVFDEVDALLFPTRYVNEAEPLTIYEAMAQGVPVIAYGRGSIGEMVTLGCGLVIDPESDFVTAAVAQLHTWAGSPQVLQETSRQARARFLQIRAESMERWEALCKDLISGAA